MPRSMTPSQYQSELRRQQQKRKQAINDLNREVKRVSDHNKRVVDKYNREVRAHNARVRSNRQKLQLAINRLNSRRTVSIRYVTYQTSVQTLQHSFTRIERASELGTWEADDELFDMVEGEAANSVALLNALEEPEGGFGDNLTLRQTVITSELLDISEDFDARWQGALFSLSSANRDAARQFCTSAREILVGILDMKAPDRVVLAANPKMDLTEHGKVPRREKIRFCLMESGQYNQELEDFVEDDINNVMDLFGAFNPATHGPAGKYDLAQLRAMKTRVEGAIQFLHRIIIVA